MSEGLVQCRKFLILISIIFHAEALTGKTWQTNAGHRCNWERNIQGNYEVVHKINLNSSRSYALLTNWYHIDERDNVPGQLCIEIDLKSSFLYFPLSLEIDSVEYEHSESKFIRCAGFGADSIKVSIRFTCRSPTPIPNPEMEIVHVWLKKYKTTSRPTRSEEEPTGSDVGDIQYVGVVVGAICIALFTLFSCLTIISARRSNQRESRGRTVPSASCQEEDDNRPDVVADNAPPSYDAVMACPDMYPPTPQDTPHVTPDTTPHLSLHRRALLNQLGSLPSSASATPSLHRHSFTPTVASDEWDDVPEYPPPPYPGLANGDVSIPIPEDTTDNTTEGVRPGIENPGISQPESENSRTSSPNQNSSPVGNQENPWVLNNSENSHLRNRDNNPASRGNTEQYPMRTRTPSNDSTHSNEDSQEESTSSCNSQVIDTNPEQNRNPKPGVDSETPNLGMRVAVV